ncbi:MAG: hypothetical protein WC494_00080 [Candidatus Pacearchaeota archaeon]
MKKEGYFLVLLLSSLFLISLVSSAYYTPGSFGSGLGFGVSQLIEIIEDVSYPLAASIFGSTEYIFEKLLFLLIIVSIIYVVLGKIPIFGGSEKTEKSIRWIVTLAIGLLATRFMIETELIQMMILPYTVLGVVLTSILPLVIYFFFVITGFQGTTLGYSVMRKVLWIFFGIVFIGIWNSRIDQIGDLAWIYLATGLISFLFLFLDGTINRAILRSKYGELKRDSLLRNIAKEKENLDEIEEWHRDNKIGEEDYKRIRRKIMKNINRLEREL